MEICIAGQRESLPAARVAAPKLVTRLDKVWLFGPTVRAYWPAISLGKAEFHPQCDDLIIGQRINVLALKILAFSKALFGRS